MADAPDYYSDQLTMTIGPFGVALTFGRSPNIAPAVPGQAQPETQAVVRMSLEHLKVMAMIIRRNLKQYELEALGDPIRLPRDVLRQLRLTDDDW